MIKTNLFKNVQDELINSRIKTIDFLIALSLALSALFTLLSKKEETIAWIIQIATGNTAARRQFNEDVSLFACYYFLLLTERQRRHVVWR